MDRNLYLKFPTLFFITWNIISFSGCSRVTKVYNIATGNSQCTIVNQTGKTLEKIEVRLITSKKDETIIIDKLKAGKSKIFRRNTSDLTVYVVSFSIGNTQHTELNYSAASTPTDEISYSTIILLPVNQ
ncbi:MAG: hypothetical protein MPJ24_02810 [Pirellulaceae bacterium]|nr:hypothetical protein [Pirellulaceae bacterium]